MDLSSTNHRRVLLGYVTRRGLSASFVGDGELMLVTGPGSTMSIQFDDLGGSRGCSQPSIRVIRL